MFFAVMIEQEVRDCFQLLPRELGNLVAKLSSARIRAGNPIQSITAYRIALGRQQQYHKLTLYLAKPV